MGDTNRILVVDDDLNTLKMVEQFLLLKNYEVVNCLTFRDALREVRGGDFSAAVIDYFMPDTNGLEMMKALQEIDPELPVLILTASRDVKIAVESIKQGAYHYLVKPVDPDELYINLDHAIAHRSLSLENERLKLDLKDKYKFDHIIGDSGVMMEVFDLTTRATGVRSTVLILGETGVGKELIARAIHYNSDRANGPFIRVNCSALAESLLEAELFGIEKNVATGVDARMGKFEAANCGTLFLDEIGDMSLNVQSKVLRAMQEREVERVGSNKPVKVDIRIVAATNRNLDEEVEKKTFRQDLFYRLNVLVIALPALRERQSDILQLIDHFLARTCEENGMKIKSASPEAQRALLTYQWPGNVRELQNSIERAVVMCDAETIELSHLPHYIVNDSGAQLSPQAPVDGASLEELVNDYERKVIIHALEKSGWKQNKAADYLSVTERSIWYKIKKLGIEINKSGDKPH